MVFSLFGNRVAVVVRFFSVTLHGIPCHLQPSCLTTVRGVGWWTFAVALFATILGMFTLIGRKSGMLSSKRNRTLGSLAG